MEEWQTKSSPLEQLFSEQGTKWEDDDELESSGLENLKKYKLATQVSTNIMFKNINNVCCCFETKINFAYFILFMSRWMSKQFRSKELNYRTQSV